MVDLLRYKNCQFENQYIHVYILTHGYITLSYFINTVVDLCLVVRR